LADAAQLAADNGLEPPSIIVIGAVVDLAETLHWFGDKTV
jgi:siroheme synthase